MGRELRKVPQDWVHPKDIQGFFVPLFGKSFTKSLEEWNEEQAKWKEGYRKKWFPIEEEDKWQPIEEEYKETTFEEWKGEKPLKEEYMPEWEETAKTHFQMYETTTEGTPISPVMDTPESLAQWLVDNNASAFGSMTASYEDWWHAIMSGVEECQVFRKETN